MTMSQDKQAVTTAPTPAHVRMSLLAALTAHHLLIRHPRTKWRLVDTTAGDTEAIKASALHVPHKLAGQLLADGLIRQTCRHPRLYILSQPSRPPRPPRPKRAPRARPRPSLADRLAPSSDFLAAQFNQSSPLMSMLEKGLRP